jgi:hypothetical protein
MASFAAVHWSFNCVFMVKMNKEEMKKIKKWREKIVVDGVLLYVVDIQNQMVIILTKESMVKIKKFIKIYGGPHIMLVHLI